MIDSSLPEGEWEDYPLVPTSGSERRRFEARLAVDPELSMLARELEEGMLALALSAPQCPAPPQAWHNIQAAINPRHNWNLWLFLAGLKWAAHGRIAAACLTTVCILHFVSPHHATTRVAEEAAPAKPIAPKPLDRTEDAAENAEIPVASTAESQTEAPPQKTDHHAIRSAVWSKAPAARPRITPLPTYTTTPTLPGCNRQPAFNHQANWFATASERRGNLKLASAANHVGRNNHPGVCGLFPDLNNHNPPPASGGFIPYNAPADTNAVPSGLDFMQGADVNDIPMLQSGHQVVALIGPGLILPGAEPLTVWFIDANGNVSVLETINPGNGPTVAILPAIDAVDGEQYLITPENSDDVVGEFPPAQ